MKFYTKNFKIAIALLFLLAGLHSVILAQRVVTGSVRDANTGEPLIGASVRVKEDQSKGTTADLEGKFRLQVGPNAATLVFSYTGYETKQESIAGRDVLDVTMTDGSVLKDVVVIGYGTVKREDATGLVQSVSSDRFNRGAITGPQELLAGKIAGVVITTDGSPGGGSQIRIRGESSLSASKDPLIVVDGVPLDNGGVSGSRNQLNFLNPNDIETFTVLKDASAAAIYGNRASGGVIIITTKKGKLDRKIAVDYNMNVSIGETFNRMDVLSADEFRQTLISRYPDTADLKNPTRLLGTANTDWQDQIFRRAIGTDRNWSISGGVGVVPYRVSMGYTSKEGLLKTDKFQRYSSALNLNPGFLDNTLQINIGLKGMVQDNHFGDKGAIGNALSFDPTKPVYDESSRFGGFYAWTTNTGAPNALAPTNPVALLNLRNDNSRVKQYIANLSVDYRFWFLRDLRINLLVGRDWANGSGSVVVPNYAAFAYDAINGGGVYNVYDQTKRNDVLESYLNYKKTFGEHTLELMGGYSWQHFYVNNIFRNANASVSFVKEVDLDSPAEFYLISLYSRVNYDFNNRILFTGTIRRDGTSRFDPNFRYGLFPAAALGIKIIENNREYFNFLKLRLSVGVTGQQDIGSKIPDFYAYQAQYVSSQNNAQYQFGDEFITTSRPNGYVANIQWEETTSYNAGLDFTISKALSGALDIYTKDTRQLLNNIPFPAGSNLTNFLTTNIGTMRSQGVEFSLNYSPVMKKNLRWDLSANLAYNQAEITKLTTSDDPDYQGVATGDIAGGVGSKIQIHTVGFTPSSFYVFKQLYDENGNIREGQFADLNGDSVINEKDKYRFNFPAPRYSFGLSSNLTAGRFDFSFAGRANLGQYVYNNIQTDMGYLRRLYNASGNGYLSNVNQSALDLNVEDQGKLTFSDHFVTKASFFRIDHVTAGYTIPNLIGNSLRFYATVQNPLLVTAYKGLDPEISNGIDNNVYPRPRTYLAGFSISF